MEDHRHREQASGTVIFCVEIIIFARHGSFNALLLLSLVCALYNGKQKIWR